MSNREQELEHLKRLRAIHQANIRDLEEKLALHGPLAEPTHLLRELEIEQEGLQQAEERLAALLGEGSGEVTVEQAAPVSSDRPQVVASGDGAAAVGGDVVTGEKVEVEKPAETQEKPAEAEAIEPSVVELVQREQPASSQEEPARRGTNWEQVGAIAGAIGLLIALAAWLIPGAGSYLFRTPAGEPVELAFWFEVKAGDADEFVQGVEGGKYRSGETLRFHFTPKADGYAYLFSLDTAGKFTPLWPDYASREARQVKAGEDYQTIEFRLDQSEGQEQFFAVASTRPFSYEEDVEPHLQPKPLPGGKGVDPVLKLLELREDRFFHEKITFTHLS